MDLPFYLAQGLRSLREEGEGVASLLTGHLATQVQEARPLRGLNVDQERGAALQVGAGVGPAGVSQHLSEAQKGLAVLAGQGRERLRGHGEAMCGQVVGALGQHVHKAHQGLAFLQGKLAEEDGAHIEELDGQGGRAPGALVEVPTQAHPLADLSEGDVGQRPRAGAEEGRRQGRRQLHQVAAVVGPAPQGVELHEGEHDGAGAEVLAGGFPGAPGATGELQAVLRPKADFVRLQQVAGGPGGAAELDSQGGRKRGQLFLVTTDETAQVLATQRWKTPPLLCCAAPRGRR